MADLTDLEKNILDRIKQSMKIRGVNQSDLAQCLGVKQYSVSRMLSGAPFPSIQQLIIIAEKLDVSLYYLVGVQEESYRELSSRAKNVADAFEHSNETIKSVIELILRIQ